MNRPLVLVTGATAGIGRAIAESLAARRASVIVTGRDLERGECFATEARRRGWDIRFMQADFSDQAGTLAFAARIRAQNLPVDVLVNNVGGVWPNRRLSRDGQELTLAVNHIHPFILSEALFPLLASRRGKIIHLTTGYHLMVRVRKADWNQQRWDSGMNVYGRSKLVSVLAGWSLCERWAAEGVVVQFADPGMAWTPLTSAMGRECFPWYGRFLVPGIRRVQRLIPLEWAARPAVSLALDAADRRPGLYAIPGGLRFPMHPTPGTRRLGRFFLGLTLDRWLAPETRQQLDQWSAHGRLIAPEPHPGFQDGQAGSMCPRSSTPREIKMERGEPKGAPLRRR